MSSLLLLLFVIKLIRYCSLQIYPSGRVSCNWLSLRLVSLLFSLLIITPSYNCGHIKYIDSTNLSFKLKLLIESDVVKCWYTGKYWKNHFLCVSVLNIIGKLQSEFQNLLIKTSSTKRYQFECTISPK